MKNLMKMATLALFAGVLSFSSCKTDPCKDITCQNGGVCESGLCTCAAGYEGDKCETESRTKFIGTFNGTETCTTGNDAYAITTSTSASGVTKVILTNLYNQGFVVTGTVSGKTITFGAQTVGSSGTQLSNATGSLSGTTLTITYTLTPTIGASNTCTFTGNKL